MLMDIKLRKYQLYKIIQLSGFLTKAFSNVTGNLAKKNIIRPCYSFG